MKEHRTSTGYPNLTWHTTQRNLTGSIRIGKVTWTIILHVQDAVSDAGSLIPRPHGNEAKTQGAVYMCCWQAKAFFSVFPLCLTLYG